VRIIDLNSGSGAHGTPAHAVYAASKAGLFRIAESLVVHGHDRGLRVFEMAPGVVESDMTRSMPMHDYRTGADWTDPQEVADLAVGLASGLLDGVDTPQSLADAQPALVSGEAGEDFRRLALRMH
jgi:NAD(P)-dependent dehydrogenase (short-subunit alcohol dehydrogenase family)